MCYLAAYGIAQPVMELLPQPVFVPAIWWERLTKLVGMGLYTVLNYFGQRFFAFRKQKK